ncbi:hypothetical protein PMAYCL1PPCAC_14453, partial [Pristionchus mayeri]
ERACKMKRPWCRFSNSNCYRSQWRKRQRLRRATRNARHLQRLRLQSSWCNSPCSNLSRKSYMCTRQILQLRNANFATEAQLCTSATCASWSFSSSAAGCSLSVACLRENPCAPSMERSSTITKSKAPLCPPTTRSVLEHSRSQL